MRGWFIQLVAFLVVLASLAFGQVGNGTITGTVIDPTGAVLAGASVEAKNAETGVVYRAASTTTGNYTIGDLPVGTYTVTVSASGFSTGKYDGIPVSAGLPYTLPVSLAVSSSRSKMACACCCGSGCCASSSTLLIWARYLARMVLKRSSSFR